MFQPHARSFESQSPALAFLAVILALFGITDLVTLSLPEEISLVHYWGMQGPSPAPSLSTTQLTHVPHQRPSA